MLKVTSTRTQRVELRPDGVIQTSNLIKDEQTLEDARENVSACAEVAGGMRRPVFVDTTLPSPLSAAAQEYYNSPEAAEVFTAVAILATNTLGRIIGNLMLGRRRAPVAIRLFDSERSALAWLANYPPVPR